MNRDYRTKENLKIRSQEIAWHNKRPLYAAVKRAKQRAKLKGLEFNLDDRLLFAPEFCPVLGLKLRYGVGHTIGGDSPSLDRIRPGGDYTMGNVRVISHRANTIKSDATIEELAAVLADLKNLLDRQM